MSRRSRERARKARRRAETEAALAGEMTGYRLTYRRDPRTWKAEPVLVTTRRDPMRPHWRLP